METADATLLAWFLMAAVVGIVLACDYMCGPSDPRFPFPLCRAIKDRVLNGNRERQLRDKQRFEQQRNEEEKHRIEEARRVEQRRELAEQQRREEERKIKVQREQVYLLLKLVKGGSSITEVIREVDLSGFFGPERIQAYQHGRELIRANDPRVTAESLLAVLGVIPI